MNELPQPAWLELPATGRSRPKPWDGLARFGLFVYAPTVLLLVGLVALARFTGTPVAVLTRDAAIVGEDVPYAGAISNLGAVIWCVAAVTSLLVAAFLYRVGTSPEGWNFLFAAGALSTVLLFDDLFLLHDEILPEYAGIPQKLVLLVYALLTVAFAWRFRWQILATRYAPLALGLLFFAASIVVDEAFGARDFDVTILGEPLQAKNLLEDGFKLLGLVSWCGYLLSVSWRSLLASSDAANQTRRA